MDQTRRIALSQAAYGLPLWFLICVILSTLTGLWSFTAADPIQQWQLWARYTARISFPVFILIYAARPLYQQFSWLFAEWLVRNRRYLGLAFAFLHGIHLIALVGYTQIHGEPIGWVTLIGGSLGYVFALLLAATSNNLAMSRLGSKVWKRLHLVGVHYLAFAFFQTYLGRVLGEESLIFLIHVIAIVLIVALRLKLFTQDRKVNV